MKYEPHLQQGTRTFEKVQYSYSSSIDYASHLHLKARYEQTLPQELSPELKELLGRLERL